MPSQATVPGIYKVPSYPLVQRGLWPFIWMGDVGRADQALIPSDEEMGFGVEGYVYKPFKTMHVNGRCQLLDDNLRGPDPPRLSAPELDRHGRECQRSGGARSRSERG